MRNANKPGLLDSTTTFLATSAVGAKANIDKKRGSRDDVIDVYSYSPALFLAKSSGGRIFFHPVNVSASRDFFGNEIHMPLI